MAGVHCHTSSAHVEGAAGRNRNHARPPDTTRRRLLLYQLDQGSLTILMLILLLLDSDTEEEAGGPATTLPVRLLLVQTFEFKHVAEICITFHIAMSKSNITTDCNT